MAAPTCREVRPTTSLARACWLTVRAATRTGRRSSESLRAPARTNAPHTHAIVHTQQHICMTKHKHDSSTIMHTARSSWSMDCIRLDRHPLIHHCRSDSVVGYEQLPHGCMQARANPAALFALGGGCSRL